MTLKLRLQKLTQKVKTQILMKEKQENLKNKTNPIIVNEIPNIIKFLNAHPLTKNIMLKPNQPGISLKFLDSVRDMSLYEFFKQNNIQFYIVPHMEIPLKVVIRGFPRTLDMDSVLEILNCRGFTILKLSQMKMRKNESPSLPCGIP